ncbi:cell division protein ZipA [Pseudidiomarina planktonica]|uniref:Cell division protein ZipA n=1 Tax=Pseudidiomarina planktonica TaxID=1323738 RepID=A0A1Y6EWQ7_9GAMM|nr:cell division protein ZipA [Pseudidiomarina planktonica]RUO65059.1 cell division protein ZipA [Pseudidiomarina planktonica]SMQ67108.1 cell division protein ZipA [Pseudidiomarina planktonica]
MNDLQIAFSVVGVLLILAIIGHGMWTIRRNDKMSKAQHDALARKRKKRDEQGFDADGIGEVRVVDGADVPKPSRDSKSGKVDKDPLTSAQAAMPDTSEPLSGTKSPEPSDSEFDSIHVDADERLTPVAPAAREAKSDSKADTKPERAAEAKAEPKAASKPTQMDLHIDEVTETEGITAEPEEVIALHVKGDIQGAILLQQMTELGFKFGEFDIFHRHETTAGTGPVLFSLANMFNPGTFDIDEMEVFKTQGIALFLALPVKGSAQQAFNMMHNAAQKIAKAVENGQVLDEHRNPLTRQTVQHIQQRIREFERRQLLRNH